MAGHFFCLPNLIFLRWLPPASQLALDTTVSKCTVLQLHAHTLLVKKFSPCLLQESPGLMALGSPTCLSATWTCCNFECQGPTNVLFVAKCRFDCKRECSEVDLLCKQHIGGITLLSRLLLDQTQLYGRYMTSAILEFLHRPLFGRAIYWFGGFVNKPDGPWDPNGLFQRTVEEEEFSILVVG